MTVTFIYFIPFLALIVFSYFERRQPLFKYQTDRQWFKRLGVLSILGVLATTLIGLALQPLLMQATRFHPLLSVFNAIPPVLNGLLAYLSITFFIYWWHRYRHHNNWAWRLFHQIHHSTHRLQAATALYAHPSDFVANILIINLVAYGLLGLTIESAAWASAWVAIFEYWEHTNVKTPHWLGDFLVRPEMHRIHHERERHSNNYGLPIWDLIFGTYENSSRPVECGFDIALEERLKEMLAGKQIQ